MDLLDETRQLVHTGKLLRPPDGNFELSGWTELFVILFDNYCKAILGPSRDRTHWLPFSGHDEDKGEGWYHEVLC